MSVIDSHIMQIWFGSHRIKEVYHRGNKIWPKVIVYTNSPISIQEINEPFNPAMIGRQEVYNGALVPPFILKDKSGLPVTAPYKDGTVKWFSSADATTGVGGVLFVASQGKWHGLVRAPMGGTNRLDAADSPAFWGVRFESDGWSCADFKGFEWTKKFILLVHNNGTATVCADAGMALRSIPPVLNLPAGMVATDLQDGSVLVNN
jgi:hypothetical protein